MMCKFGTRALYDDYDGDKEVHLSVRIKARLELQKYDTKRKG